MRIEKIEKSKHKQERVLVYLEGGDLLRITESELLRFGLYRGLDISPETVVELKRYGAKSETRATAANIISSRPLSKAELQRRLVKKGAQEEDAESAVEYLERIGAVDDVAYAQMLVRHYSARAYGEARIRDELFHRGVPHENWDEALEALPDAQELIEKYVLSKTKVKTLDSKEYKRLCDALLRRGFRWGDVKSVMNRLGAEIHDEED